MAAVPRPISTTTASVSSAAPSKVMGTPSSLLKERSLAAVRHRWTNTTARRSFTEVLPTEPVIPITGRGRRRRASRPATWSAATVSATTTAVPPTGERAVR